MKALPFIVTIFVIFPACFITWGLVPEQSDVARREIQKTYDRQDAGLAAKDHNEIFYHSDPQGTQTDVDGIVTKVSDLQNGYLNDLLSHCDNFHTKTKITSTTVARNTATVIVTFKRDFTT